MKKLIKQKIKELENEAEELIQDRDNQEGGEQLLCAVDILKELIEPKSKKVFLIIDTDKKQINGAFFKKSDAEKYKGSSDCIIQKIQVI